MPQRIAKKRIKSKAEYIQNGISKDVSIKISTDGKIRYTVPQLVTQKKDISVFFRVGNVYDNVVLKVKNSSNEVVYSKKMQKAVPATMESVTIKAQALEGTEELFFELEENK